MTKQEFIAKYIEQAEILLNQSANVDDFIELIQCKFCPFFKSSDCIGCNDMLRKNIDDLDRCNNENI